MTAAARIMVVPGRIGTIVPINPTANRTIVMSQQRSSIDAKRNSRFVNRESESDRSNVSRSPFDRAIVDPILNSPRFNSNRRLVYATCSWNQSSRFHPVHQNRRRPEANQVERQFREEKLCAAVFSDEIGRAHV